MFSNILAAFDGDSTTVTFDELLCNEESNSCPNRGTSRKERIAHPRQSFWRDPFAVIPYAKDNTLRLCFRISYFNVDGSSCRKGVNGIGEEI